MSLEPTKHLGHGGIGMDGDKPKKLFDELQGLTTQVVAGTTANTDIPVTGIAAGDTIQSVVAFAGGTPSLITTNSVTVKAGAIAISTNTTGSSLVVTFFRKAGVLPPVV